MTLFILLVSTSLMATPVYAYIDPGTGSFLLQGLIATFLTISFAIKGYWQQVKHFFSKKNKKKKPVEE